MNQPAEQTAGRILVVDDDPAMIHTVSRILRRRHEVLTASTPTEAMEKADRDAPDVAIIDVRMPEMNGFELMQALVRTRPDLDVILMTGNVAESDANLVRAIDEGAFYFIQKPFDRRVLQTLVGRCLELRRLREAGRRHTQRLERELDDARSFQISLLPARESTVAGAAICARYFACDELGGDFFDYTAAGDDRAAIVIADVSGHGASAAMMTGIVKSAFHAAHADGYEPRAVVHRVADAIRAFDPGRFVTLVCAMIDGASRTLSYVSAGHPHPVVHGPGGGVRLLGPTGPLISSGFPDPAWEQEEIELAPDDRLLLYTDGLLEARGDDGMFGRDRIVSAVTRDGTRGGALLDGIIEEVQAFSGARPRDDDLTLVTVDFVNESRKQKVGAIG